MIVGGALRAQHRRLLEECQRLLDDFGWQGFIEDSDHPAHDLRLVLEEAIVLGTAIDALATFIDAGPGGSHEHQAAETLAGQAATVIAATHARVSVVRDPAMIAALEGHLRLIADAVDVAVVDFRQRPRDERQSLADALFGG